MQNAWNEKSSKFQSAHFAVSDVPIELIFQPEFSHERLNCKYFIDVESFSVHAIAQHSWLFRSSRRKENYFWKKNISLTLDSVWWHKMNWTKQVMHCSLIIIIIITWSRCVHIPFCFILSIFRSSPLLCDINTFDGIFVIWKYEERKPIHTHAHAHTYKMHK